MRRTLSFLILICVLAAVCHAREIPGRVVDTGKAPIADASVIISIGDSIAGIVYTDAKGGFPIKWEGELCPHVEVQALGYESGGRQVVASDKEIVISLVKSDKVTDLAEITVEADRGGTIKRLANGNRFFLSKNAKAMNDPFMALKEIPTLVSDAANRSLTTVDGKQPLILVNGIELNSGITPILPEDIEYVEVIDAVPAKYLARGVSSIVNVQLRKNRPPYIWTEVATRHELPVRNGFGVGYFEVGNEKVSLYGRTSYNYTHHDDMEGNVDRSNTGYSQKYDWNSRSDGHSWLGELLFKYVPTQKDYFAVEGFIKGDLSKSHMDKAGSFTTDIEEAYSMSSRQRNRSTIFTGSAYYKHIFSANSELEMTAGYNHNYNRLNTDGNEYFGSDLTVSDSRFRNTRNSGNVNINYQLAFSNGGILTAGSTTSLLHDRILNFGNPTFIHTNYDEYLYASYTGSVGRLYYMGSAGVQATWLKAGGGSNSYVRPRISVSGTYVLNSSNSLQLYYISTNTSPEVGELNPYNTSTDSLVVIKGNPGLVPQMAHDLVVTYSFSKGPFYSWLRFGGDLYTDLILPSGFTENGIYTNTYANQGKYRQIYTQLNASWRFGRGNLSGRLSGGGQWVRKFFEGCRPKDQFSFNCGLDAWLGKFYLGAQLSVSPRTYSDISTVRNMRPVMSSVQLNYNITDNLYVAVCLQGFAGSQKSRTTTANGPYHMSSFVNMKETGFHPWLLLRWNMRKNVKRKINLDKVLESTESGIRLKY